MVAEIATKAIQKISLSELQALLIAYFKTPYKTLLARENMPQTQSVQAMSYDGIEAPGTGESLKSKLTWTQFREIILKLEEIAVTASFVQYKGRHVYVLACWVGHEDPKNEHNILEFGPKPKTKQTATAIKILMDEIQRIL